MVALREVLARFNIDVNNDQLERANRGVGRFKDRLRSVGGLLAGGLAGVGIVRFAQNQAQLAREVNAASEVLGVQEDTFQGLSNAARQFNVDQKQVRDSLQTLIERVDEFKLGAGEAQEALGREGLGLDATQLQAMSTEEQLFAVSDAMANVEDRTTRVRIATQLFEDEGTRLLPILGEGSDQLRQYVEQGKEFGAILDETESKQMKAFSDRAHDISLAIRGLMQEVAVAALPILRTFSSVVERLATALQENESLATTLKIALFGLAAALGAVAVAKLAAFWELIVIFGALFVVVEDVVTLIQGGDSALGRFLKSLLGVKKGRKAVQGIRKDWQGLNAAIEESPGIIDDFGRVVLFSLQQIGDGILGFSQWVINTLVGSFLAAARGIEDVLTGNFDNIGQRMKQVFTNTDVFQGVSAGDVFGKVGEALAGDQGINEQFTRGLNPGQGPGPNAVSREAAALESGQSVLSTVTAGAVPGPSPAPAAGGGGRNLTIQQTINADQNTDPEAVRQMAREGAEEAIAAENQAALQANEQVADEQ